MIQYSSICICGFFETTGNITLGLESRLLMEWKQFSSVSIQDALAACHVCDHYVSCDSCWCFQMRLEGAQEQCQRQRMSERHVEKQMQPQQPRLQFPPLPTLVNRGSHMKWHLLRPWSNLAIRLHGGGHSLSGMHRELGCLSCLSYITREAIHVLMSHSQQGHLQSACHISHVKQYMSRCLTPSKGTCKALPTFYVPLLCGGTLL
jgi:hypothetical protein